MTAPTNTPQVEAIRAQFELAYATAWASDSQRTETPAQLAEVVKTWRDSDTYPMDMPRLRFGWEAYQWAIAQRVAAKAVREFHAVIAPCGEGVLFSKRADARWTLTGQGVGSDGFGVPTIADAFRESYGDSSLELVQVRVVEGGAV